MAGAVAGNSNRLTKRSFLLLSAAISLICLSPVKFTAAQDITFFRIGTGSTSGTYYPIGTLIASIISNPPGSRACEDGGSCGVQGLIAAAQTTRGSIDNIRRVMNGSLETGLAQSDIVQAAYSGTGVFKGKKPKSKLRVIANLYPEDVHLIVRRGAGISSIKDLKGKRVSFDLPGSGTRVNAEEILAALGFSGKDIKAVAVNADKAVALMLDDELDAFFFVAGYPVAAVSELARAGKIDLLPLGGDWVKKFVAHHKYYSLSEIPDETYPGIKRVSTLAVSTQWIVNADMDEDLVYEVTRALWHPRNRQLLDHGHVKGKKIRLETALEGVSTPLHPGAERYYREKGLIEK
ncbi:MAG: TAXI family TRAP transporter solute-binding subunit [Alphaproteobacteria bacterium]|nr:MAG: TAXI family TRAP transporter solute-binding subunit [Alphaproteobacteria bacterium]